MTDPMFNVKHSATDAAALMQPARVVDFVIAAMDRTAHRSEILSALVNVAFECGHHLHALTQDVVASCEANPAEAVALLRRAERRLGKAVAAIGTGEDDTLAEMTRDGITIAALRYAHAAYGVAAIALETNASEASPHA